MMKDLGTFSLVIWEEVRVIFYQLDKYQNYHILLRALYTFHPSKTKS